MRQDWATGHGGAGHLPLRPACTDRSNG